MGLTPAFVQLVSALDGYQLHKKAVKGGENKMSIKFTNEDPSYQVNERLIMDRLKITQEYDVVLFTESSNETNVSPAINVTATP